MHGLDDPSSRRGDVPKGVNVSHHVMSTFLLLHSSDLELFCIEVLKEYTSMKSTLEERGKAYEVVLHLFDGIVWDRQAELLFCNGEVEPQLAPCVEAILCPDNAQLKKCLE